MCILIIYNILDIENIDNYSYQHYYNIISVVLLLSHDIIYIYNTYNITIQINKNRYSYIIIINNIIYL